MQKMLFRYFSIIGCAITFACGAERPPVHPQSIELEHVQVEYPESLAVQSGALAYWLNNGYPGYESHIRTIYAQRKKHATTDIEADTDWLIQELGLEEKPETTLKLYERFQSIVEEIFGDRLLDTLLFRHAYVISQDDLKQRLNEKGFVDNLSHSADMDKPYNFTWGLNASGDIDLNEINWEPTGRYEEFALPIIIKDTSAPFGEQLKNTITDTKSFIEGFGGGGAQLTKYLGQLSQFLALHEAAEWTLTSTTIVSDDRRWFADGVANYLTKKRIFETAENPQQFWNAIYGERDKSRLSEVDLINWKAAENETEEDDKTQDLKDAYYLLATATIELIADTHGEDFLPSLLKEVRKTSLEETTIQTVYDSFTLLTKGEDMKAYIEKARAKLLAPQG
ncbi:MAG: hypothetical protein ACLFUF_07305 [Opitutales bacterium]